MKKQDISVGSLVGMIESGELQLPEIQRRYVWRGPRVRDLLDSLYRGYPSGSILVWETEQDIPTRKMGVDQGKTPFAGRKLLLDGQQRLTSLTAVLKGHQVSVRGRKKPIDILFNIDHPEGAPTEMIEVLTDEESPVLELDIEEEGVEEEDEGDGLDLQERLKLRTFVVASKAMAQLPNWVSVSRVFTEDGDTEILKRAGINSFDDPRYKRYVGRLGRLRSIRNYMYVMHVLERDYSYEEVAEIFVRVNSLGVKLRSSDLALAQITARWPKSLQLLEEFQGECEEKWFTLDLGLLVRSMVVFASHQCKFNSVAGIKIERLKKGWDTAKDGLRFAINFLASNAGIEDESLLSSPFLMVPLAVLSQLRRNKLSAAESRGLLYWLHAANARGRYSRGSSETLLNEDLAILFKDGAAKDLLEPLKRQFGRLDIETGDLAGRGERNPLFALAFLALKAQGAKDWQSGLGISLKHKGKLHYIEYHHIFPKALLKKAGYEQGQINEIANMAFISGDTNRKLSDTAPADYFPSVIKRRGQEALRSQAIPLDPKLLRVENYPTFLEARRELLAKAIDGYIDSALHQA
jgi:hypothetical protein